MKASLLIVFFGDAGEIGDRHFLRVLGFHIVEEVV